MNGAITYTWASTRKPPIKTMISTRGRSQSFLRLRRKAQHLIDEIHSVQSGFLQASGAGPISSNPTLWLGRSWRRRRSAFRPNHREMQPTCVICPKKRVPSTDRLITRPINRPRLNQSGFKGAEHCGKPGDKIPKPRASSPSARACVADPLTMPQRARPTKIAVTKALKRRSVVGRSMGLMALMNQRDRPEMAGHCRSSVRSGPRKPRRRP